MFPDLMAAQAEFAQATSNQTPASICIGVETFITVLLPKAPKEPVPHTHKLPSLFNAKVLLSPAEYLLHT